MQVLIDVILPVFLVIGAGYLATRQGMFTPSHIEGIMKFTQGFAIPCLLFNALAKIDLQQGFDPALLTSFYAGAFICFLLGMFGARFLFDRDWEDSVAIGFACLFSNSILLGLPITERAYGADALEPNYAIISVHSPLCYGIGITVMEIVRNRGKGLHGTSKAILKAMFSNALVIGISLGFIVNLSGLPVPLVFQDAIDLMSRAALPAALFGLGGVLYRYRPEGDLKTILFACAISLLIHPAIVWGMGSALGLSTGQFRSAVVTAAMAPGINTYVFANMYGAARRVAASAVLIGTLGCVLTAWMWLTLLP